MNEIFQKADKKKDKEDKKNEGKRQVSVSIPF